MKKRKGGTLDEVAAETLAAMEEIYGASERAGAIVAAAQVEDHLAKIILSRMKPLTETELTTLLSGSNAPLGTFYSKIHIGYALGIYSAPVRDDLGIIKDIRNRFAHEISVRTFSDPKIGAWCANLNFPFCGYEYVGGDLNSSLALEDAKTKFEATTNHFYHMLLIGSNRLSSAGQTATSKAFIDYPFRPGAKKSQKQKAPRIRPSRG